MPLHGSYLSDLLPGFVVMSLGAGSVFVSVTAAANAGVPSDKAGLAAGLLNSSQQVGSALGLAVLSAVAITRTDHLVAAQVSPVLAADAGYHQALLVGSHLDGRRGFDRPAHRQHPEAAPMVMVNAEVALSRSRRKAALREPSPGIMSEMTDSVSGQATAPGGGRGSESG